MGLGLEHVSDDDRRRYTLRAAGQDGVVRFVIGDRTLTPPEISALILRELKRRAEAALGEPIKQAVITVPAYFNDSAAPGDQGRGHVWRVSRCCGS